METLPAKLAVWRTRLPPEILAAVGDELDGLMGQLSIVQQQLLEPEGNLMYNTLESFINSYAMMDWSSLRESRF